VALAALGAVAMLNVASATETAGTIVVSTVSDPVGDANFNAPAFQDVVLVQMTKTAGGNFELLMEMAGPVPVDPPLPPPGHGQVTWVWNFDLDPTTFPAGYPYLKATGPAEFSVGVSWDGAEFAGAAIDRRPLLAGGKAIITSIPFTIDGPTVEAFLDSELIGEIPASFGWCPFTFLWSGPVGSEGVHFADYCEAGGVFNP
jgi:hypothetical protein